MKKKKNSPEVSPSCDLYFKLNQLTNLSVFDKRNLIMCISSWLNWSCCLVPFVAIARHSNGLMFFLNAVFNIFIPEFILIVTSLLYSNQTLVVTDSFHTKKIVLDDKEFQLLLYFMSVAAKDNGFLWFAKVLKHVEIRGGLIWLLFSPGTILNHHNNLWMTEFLEGVYTYQWMTVM